MTYPNEVLGTEMCITVTPDGVTVYGNRQAFKSLAEWMTWIADADESEHYECHLGLHLQSMASTEGKEPKNVWVLLDKNIADSFVKRTKDTQGFELTFMAVEPKDLAFFRQCQDSELLPEKSGSGLAPPHPSDKISGHGTPPKN